MDGIQGCRQATLSRPSREIAARLPRSHAAWEGALEELRYPHRQHIYFGPKAPEGHEANRVQTNPDKGWFVYFREPFFDKTWALPYIAKID